MNKYRRKVIAKAIELLDEAHEMLEIAANDEMEYAENMPENLQGSERHESAEEAAYQLESGAGDVEMARDAIQEVIDNF